MPKLPLPQGADIDPRRRNWLGIRAQLLILLLPGVALLLGIDSWGDHHARISTIESAYDEALLDQLWALDNSVHVQTNGRLALAAPVAVPPLTESVQVGHKHLHVGLLPLDADTLTAERTLMGVDDLPMAPPGAEPATPVPNLSGAYPSRTVFYTASYRGDQVRVAELQREVSDFSGHRYQLRVQAAESLDRRNEARQASLHHEFLQDLRMLALTALLVWLGTTWALRPLKRLRESLRKRLVHDLHPLNASGLPYEVAPLVQAINLHISRHQQLLAEQGDFLADASHQLRTPLAIMTTQAGYALREQDPELLHETLRAIIAQLARSRRLSDQLLSMAHASQATHVDEPLPLIDLNAVSREVVLLYLTLAHEKNLDLGWIDIRGEDMHDDAAPGLPDAPVRGQAPELHEALANLVHNAIRYTPAGGSITVAVRIEGNSVIAEVSDTGPGIAPQRREAVFQRLQRSSTTQRVGGQATPSGAGLGLAIARAYARRYGGDIVLSDAIHRQAKDTGLCARLVLPLAERR